MFVTCLRANKCAWLEPLSIILGNICENIFWEDQNLYPYFFTKKHNNYIITMDILFDFILRHMILWNHKAEYSCVHCNKLNSLTHVLPLDSDLKKKVKEENKGLHKESHGWVATLNLAPCNTKKYEPSYFVHVDIGVTVCIQIR